MRPTSLRWTVLVLAILSVLAPLPGVLADHGPNLTPKRRGYNLPVVADLFPDDDRLDVQLTMEPRVWWIMGEGDLTAGHTWRLIVDPKPATMPVRVTYDVEPTCCPGERRDGSMNLTPITLLGDALLADLELEGWRVTLRMTATLDARPEHLEARGNTTVEHAGPWTWASAEDLDNGRRWTNVTLDARNATLGDRVDLVVSTVYTVNLTATARSPDDERLEARAALGSTPGNGTISLSWHVTNRAPSLRITMPDDGARVQGEVLLAGEAEDPDGDPMEVLLSIDEVEGGPYHVANETITSMRWNGTWGHRWDTGGLAPDAYEVTVWVRDQGHDASTFTWPARERVILHVLDDAGHDEGVDPGGPSSIPGPSPMLAASALALAAFVATRRCAP